MTDALDRAGPPDTLSSAVAAIVLQATQAPIVVLDADGRILTFNPACEELTGHRASSLTGETPWGLIHRDDVTEARETFEALRRVPLPSEHTSRWRTAHGDQRTIAWSYRALVDDDASFTGAVMTGVDCTAQREAELTLEASESALHLVVDSLPIGYYTAEWDAEGEQFVVTSANQECTNIIGATPTDDHPFPLTRFVHRDDVPIVERAVLEVIEERREVEVIVRIVSQSGELRWVRSRGAPVVDHDEIVGGVGWLTDITTEVVAEEMTAHLVEVLDEAADIVVLLGPDGTVLYANGTAIEAFGGEPDHLRDLLDDDSIARYGDEVLETLHDGSAWRGEMTVVRGDGVKVPVSQAFLGHLAADGSIERVSMIARDISESKELEERLAHLAFHDALTGLPNRALVLDRLSQALDRATRSQDLVAVMFLDLDHFKSVNDAAGHEAGDELLKIVAGRLTAAVRPGDTVSRLGGDEFVIICEGVHEPIEALRIAERVRTTTARPVTIHERSLSSSASIGVALAKNNLENPGELLTRADTAGYRAKERGRNRYELYGDRRD